MPYKYNEPHRDKIAKATYKITNWASYNKSLKQRGSLTVWLCDDMLSRWSAGKRLTRGGQALYSDEAIELCLTLRLIYNLPLRQTEGFVASLIQLLNLDLVAPNYTTLSRRGKNLSARLQPEISTSGKSALIVDSTGLKIHGEGEWLHKKHETKLKRKKWRKLHIGINGTSGSIECVLLTDESVGDTTALRDLFHQIDKPISSFIADGAYDGRPTYELIEDKFGPDVEVIVPPPCTAVVSDGAKENKRNFHVETIADKGRMAWQKQVGYGQRSCVEARIGRWKEIIGAKLKARNLQNQKTEAMLAAKALNRMDTLGQAQFTRA